MTCAAATGSHTGYQCWVHCRRCARICRITTYGTLPKFCPCCGRAIERKAPHFEFTAFQRGALDEHHPRADDDTEDT